jgi:hypothetical protein
LHPNGANKSSSMPWINNNPAAFKRSKIEGLHFYAKRRSIRWRRSTTYEDRKKTDKDKDRVLHLKLKHNNSLKIDMIYKKLIFKILKGKIKNVNGFAKYRRKCDNCHKNLF